MKEKKETEQNLDEGTKKREIIMYIKEHKTQLLFAGVSITVVLTTVLGQKNKNMIIELWNSLKKKIERGSLYSSKWFEKASLEELETARKSVQQDYNNPRLDVDYRSECWNLLKRIDNAIGIIKWGGKEYGYPVHSSNGWYLPSDD
ncbi:MAG: hypothetical protein IJB84_01035 [Lachnospiraceae bacterium]|nr:hypothetical protein [Lachnospiraceae bacterium]